MTFFYPIVFLYFKCWNTLTYGHIFSSVIVGWTALSGKIIGVRFMFDLTKHL